MQITQGYNVEMQMKIVLKVEVGFKLDLRLGELFK